MCSSTPAQVSTQPRMVQPTELDVDPESGLDAGEVERRLSEYGPNELPKEPPRSTWVVARGQLSNPMNGNRIHVPRVPLRLLGRPLLDRRHLAIQSATEVSGGRRDRPSPRSDDDTLCERCEVGAMAEYHLSEKRRKRLEEFVALLRVKPGSRVKLARDFDPDFKAGVVKKKDGVALLEEGIALMSEYQARLAAQDTWGVLVVLQALDAAGKDGTIRHVMSGVNPQGVSVNSFKVPSAEELDHDFLWRYAQRLPTRGQIGIFNRSYYEEVLVVRVHPENLDRQKLPDRSKKGDVWNRRYREINDWERYLTDNGFRIVKLFLNLSREEQRIRFLRRIDLPDHNWKFSTADVQEREHWDAYQRAFSDMLTHTSTEWAPWYVIPADRKWFERVAVGMVLANTLLEIDPRFPKVTKQRREALHEVKQALEAQAPEGAAPDPFTGGQQDGKAAVETAV
jgi:PPK2 family polyphosphate:nucleotide phosphotransferase